MQGFQSQRNVRDQGVDSRLVGRKGGGGDGGGEEEEEKEKEKEREREKEKEKEKKKKGLAAVTCVRRGLENRGGAAVGAAARCIQSSSRTLIIRCGGRYRGIGGRLNIKKKEAEEERRKK